MPRFLPSLRVLPLLLALAPALAFAPPDGEDDPRAAALAWVAAYNAHDGAAFARHYADGAIVTLDALHCQKNISRSPPQPTSP